MKYINRTFTVVDPRKSVMTTDIRMPTTDTVEVVDLTTRAVLHVRAGDVSMYRHTLRVQGQSFNIVNIQESM